MELELKNAKTLSEIEKTISKFSGHNDLLKYLYNLDLDDLKSIDKKYYV